MLFSLKHVIEEFEKCITLLTVPNDRMKMLKVMEKINFGFRTNLKTNWDFYNQFEI